MNDSDSDSGVDLPKITGDDLEELKKYIKPVKPVKPVKPIKPVKPVKPIKPVIKKIVIPKINLKYQIQQEKEVEKLWHNKRQEEIKNSMNKNKINNNVGLDSEHDSADVSSDESSTPINKSIITKIDLENLEERIKNVVIQSRPQPPLSPPNPPPVASPQGAPVQSKYKHTWTDAKGFVWHF